MGATFDALKDQLNFRLGNRKDPQIAGELRIPDMLPIWVNAAYVDLGTKIRLPELEETATLVVAASDLDHPRYLLPTDYFSLVYIRDQTNGKSIDPLPLLKLRNKNSTATARIATYSLWRLELIFDPPLTIGESITVQLDYRKRAVKLTATDPSIFPGDWDEVIVQGAEYRALNDMGGPLKDEGAKAKVLFNLMLNERIDRRAEERLALNETAIPDKVSRIQGPSTG